MKKTRTVLDDLRRLLPARCAAEIKLLIDDRMPGGPWARDHGPAPEEILHAAQGLAVDIRALRRRAKDPRTVAFLRVFMSGEDEVWLSGLRRVGDRLDAMVPRRQGARKRGPRFDWWRISFVAELAACLDCAGVKVTKGRDGTLAKVASIAIKAVGNAPPGDMYALVSAALRERARHGRPVD